MNPSWEAQIREALMKLIPGTAVEALVREAKTEMTQEELKQLSGERQAKWRRLSSPSRKLEWSEARRCEKFLHEKLGPEARTSLSHTRLEERPIVFAVGAKHPGPIGIDVELSSRRISETVARRFTLPGEQELGVDPLQLWVIKEAVMKAYPDNHGTVPGQYRVLSFDPSTRTGLASLRDQELHYCCVSIPNWTIALAVS